MLLENQRIAQRHHKGIPHDQRAIDRSASAVHNKAAIIRRLDDWWQPAKPEPLKVHRLAKCIGLEINTGKLVERLWAQVDEEVNEPIDRLLAKAAENERLNVQPGANMNGKRVIILSIAAALAYAAFIGGIFGD